MVKTVVLSASIDNEDAIREWIDTVGEATRAVQAAFDALSEQLRAAPHISITLHQNP